MAFLDRDGGYHTVATCPSTSLATLATATCSINIFSNLHRSNVTVDGVDVKWFFYHIPILL